MLKRTIVVAALVFSIPVFSASTPTPTPEECKNPNRTNAMCLFNNAGLAGGASAVESASSLVAMVGSVCAMPLRMMSQFGQEPTEEAAQAPGLQQ